MDATPGSDSLASTLALPAASGLHRSARRRSMGRWWLESVLVAVVFALGLLQGSRAALGLGAPEPASEPIALGEVPPSGVREADAARGHFYRPTGSDAVRPELRLQPSRWLPARPERIALVCPGSGC